MEANIMKYSPSFTVCIPVYNTECYLEECIESVLNQTTTDYEIILVDDGSRDGSAAICDAYVAKYRFIRVLHKQNEGLLLARYDAIRHACGRYLVFLDSDDFLYPEALCVLKKAIDETQADMVLFDLQRVYADGKTVDLTEVYKNRAVFQGNCKKQFCEELISGNRLNSMCRKCIARALCDFTLDSSEFLGLIQGEDKLLSMMFLDQVKKIVYVKEALYGYRDNAQSTTNNLTLRNYKNVQVVYRYQEIFIDRWHLSENASASLRRKNIHMACQCALSMANRMRNGLASMEDVQEAICYMASDSRLQNAFVLEKENIKIHSRYVCKAILGNQIRRIFVFECLMSYYRLIRSWIFVKVRTKRSQQCANN